MAHESFEDEATAKLMNDLFVNVKVDREERPDIDKIYQTAHQLYTGRAGGWPLTVFLTPDSHLPIFTGTYFPRERRYGMPAFREVLVAIENYYRTQGAEIRERGAGLVEAFDELATGSADDFADLSRAPLEQARERLGRSYDSDYGGFGDAPKFPHAPNLELLLAHWQRSAAPADAARRRGCGGRSARQHAGADDRRARRRGARDGHAHARPHGARRSLRSARRRLLSLQRGPPLVDSALREDALRQRGAVVRLCGRVRGDGRTACIDASRAPRPTG